MMMQLRFVTAEDALRPAVESAIRAVYAREFSATPAAFPRVLAALLDADGALLAAAALRFAADGFFSEHYLDEPVEACLGRLGRRPVARTEVMEIGSMAGFRPATCLALVDLVARRCLDDGLRWAVFTATDRLRALLRRSRIASAELARARRDRVPDAARWGTYYLHDPRVIAVEGAALPRFTAATSPAPSPEMCHA